MTLAAIRPDGAWEASLFLHIAGAMLLVGGLFVVSAALIYAWRTQDDGGEAKIRRFAYLTLFFVVLPAFFAMRIGAEWVLSAPPLPHHPHRARILPPTPHPRSIL